MRGKQIPGIVSDKIGTATVCLVLAPSVRDPPSGIHYAFYVDIVCTNTIQYRTERSQSRATNIRCSYACCDTLKSFSILRFLILYLFYYIVIIIIFNATSLFRSRCIIL